VGEPYNAGIDVSIDRLDVAIRPGGRAFCVTNDAAGWAELVARLPRGVIAAIGLEPSGGYERGVVRALLAAGLSVRRINPNKLRQFARAAGALAKTQLLAHSRASRRRSPDQTDNGRSTLAPGTALRAPLAGHKPLYILLRSEALCAGHLTTAPYLRQKFTWWDCARPADQRRDESVQLFQIHGAFVAEPAESLGEIIEFGVGKIWRSHSTFLLPYGTVNLADFETPRERPSEQFMGGFVVRH
jgi:hypothetical protein